MGILEKGSSDETRVWLGNTEIKGTLIAKDGRTGSYTIAANDTPQKLKAYADLVCTGVNDHIIIQQAINALPSTGGKIYLFEGNYHLGATLARAIDNVHFEGSGIDTYLIYDDNNFIINFGVQKGWSISNIRFDYGGFSIGTGKKWNVTNVFRDCKYHDDQIQIDQWSEEHMGSQCYNNLDSTIANHPLMVDLDNFTSGWTTSGAGASAVADTTIVHRGANSTKFTTIVTTTTNLAKSITLPDMTDVGISFWMFTPDYTKISSMQIQLQYNGVWNTDYYRDDSNFSFMPHVNNRWVKFSIPFFTKHGNAVATNLTAIRIAVAPIAGQQAVIYFNDMKYFKGKVLAPKGIVTFAFDDGCDTIYTLGKPKLDQYGYKGNWAMVLDRIRWNPNTIAWADQMQEEGWDIINHSFSHDEPRIVLEPAFQYLINQKWLADNGYKTGARFTSLCFGYHDTNLVTLTDKQMAFCMTTMGGYNAIPDTTHLLRIRALQAGILLANVKSYVDTVRQNGGILVILVHDLITGATGVQTETSDFNELVDYIASSGVEVLTYSQIAARIEHSDLTTTGTGTVANGTTTVNIRHGFHKAPKHILITPTSSLGNASEIYISSKDTGTGNLFTVTVDANPGADITFDWRAIL